MPSGADASASPGDTVQLSFARGAGRGESVADVRLLEDSHAECELAPRELGAHQRLKIKCFVVIRHGLPSVLQAAVLSCAFWWLLFSRGVFP